MTLPRRRFLSALAGALVAPAVVKAESIMPVRSPPLYQHSLRLLNPITGDLEAYGEEQGFIRVAHRQFVDRPESTLSYYWSRHSLVTPPPPISNAQAIVDYLLKNLPSQSWRDFLPGPNPPPLNLETGLLRASRETVPALPWRKPVR